MTAITATARTHRRSLAVIGAILAIALAVVTLILFKTSPAHDMHQVVTTYHHLPCKLSSALSTSEPDPAGGPGRELSISHWPARRIW